ncbi:bax inhibitor 1 [Folsomia candida]|uniref:Protein lifeguard 1 n=1 Tax=Folsomia candida TaxID=158441 RepID=A0A226EZ58_FOLCA|nr:bax inhibitor 1 [Folsomia candida]OXA62480.1 Protein lifeguard 1 [Folsomia candida]
MSYPREMEIYPQQQAPQYSTIYVEEDDVPAMRAFSTKSRRMAFVRKVLSVVMLQLLVCASLTAGCVLSSKPTKLWIHKNYFIAFIAGIFWIMINIAVGCCQVGRGPPRPLNISILVFGTICLSVFCAFITISYSQDVILYALSSTVLILLIIVVITALTPIDITGWGILLLCGSLALVLASLMAGIILIVSQSDRETMRVVAIVLCVLFIVLLTVFILYDLQLIVGGRKYQLEEADWLFACLMLFGDIVNLFLQLLQLFGLIQKN